MSSRSRLYEKKYTVDGVRRSAYGKTKLEAEVNAEIKKKEYEAGKPAPKKMTVKQWSEEWIETYKEPNINASWCRDIRGILNNHILPEIGSRPVSKIKPVDILRILNAHTDMSDSTLQKMYDIMKQIFASALDNGIITSDPCRTVKKPIGRAQDDRRIISIEERKQTLVAANNSPDGLFVLIVMYCGCRPSEVVALKRKDFDLENKVLSITHALKADGTIGRPKSKAGIRKVPIPEELKKRVADLDLKPDAYVCTNTHGGRLTKSSVRDLWDRFIYDLEIAAGNTPIKGRIFKDHLIADDLTLYCYRHTYCTDLQDAGVPINVARELMGHSDISVTSKIYTHHSEESFKDAGVKIEKRQKKDQKKEPEKAQNDADLSYLLSYLENAR